MLWSGSLTSFLIPSADFVVPESNARTQQLWRSFRKEEKKNDLREGALNS